eukprot:4547469-Pyramimonas_sp.AAC.1
MSPPCALGHFRPESPFCGLPCPLWRPMAKCLKTRGRDPNPRMHIAALHGGLLGSWISSSSRHQAGL